MSDLPPENEALVPESRSLAVPPDRVEQSEDKPYRQAARGRIVVLPFAMGLISLGILLLLEPQIEGFDVTFPIAILILLAAFVLTNLFRFFVSGRRERGLLFLALMILSFGGVLAAISVQGQQVDGIELLMFLLVGIAVSLLITYVAERQHDTGLVNLALLILLAASIALLVSQEIISQELMDTAADYFPLVIAFLGVTLVPLALRRPTE